MEKYKQQTEDLKLNKQTTGKEWRDGRYLWKKKQQDYGAA